MNILQRSRGVVCRHPGWVLGAWVLVASAVYALAPDLTTLAAEGQSRMLGRDAESRRAAELVRRAWPDQTYGSLAVSVLHREGGLTDADRAFARDLAKRFQEGANRPRPVLRVLGPDSPEEIAQRLQSADGTVTLIAVPIASPFVSPRTQTAISWLQDIAAAPAPAGLEVRWTGDAVLGRDFMTNVQTSLDRAALATVILLMGVLLLVYRSIWLALVPLATIGTSLIVARGVLAWLTLVGWDISPLVELFLVAVLFGSGTDFCLFLSWRFAENWDEADPAGAMLKTKETSSLALLTSAGTVIIGLALMGTTKFRLFSSTGPSVALGLSLTLLATLTLTPALLILLAKWRPSAFRGMTAPASGVWERVGALAMSRPFVSWVATLIVMTPLAILGLRTTVVQDLMIELPKATPSARTFALLGEKFEQGMLAPLTVVLESETDLRTSEGLALIDDLCRFLSRQRGLTEVRSATQPLGSPEPLRRARIASRVTEVNDGLQQMAGGASELQKGLYEGAAKLQAAIWLEARTGLPLAGTTPDGKPSAEPRRVPPEVIADGLGRVSSALLGKGIASAFSTKPKPEATTVPGPDPAPTTAATKKAPDPRVALIREILRAAEGAQQLATGASRARGEVDGILSDPVGRRSLDRLLINPETVKEFPELERSFAAYITPDGRTARIDLSQADRVFSGGAMNYVERLRRLLTGFLEDAEGPRVKASLAGPNAENADIRALTRSDQLQSWFVIPLGVFLVLLVALRDPLACLNLVGTMLLTYAFALGATHLVFVTGMGAEGLDWKVPYFLFVLLVAVGVDYNVFLMARLGEESHALGLRPGIVKAIGSTGGLISSAAAITACSFASFMTSPLISLQQLGFALVVGISVDALLVRPLLVPCGHWLLARHRVELAATPDPAAGRSEPKISPRVREGSPALVD